MSEEEDEEEEEDQRKTSKLIAYLSIKRGENCKRENAMPCQIGVSKISIVYSLNIIRISAKFTCNKLIPY